MNDKEPNWLRAIEEAKRLPKDALAVTTDVLLATNCSNAKLIAIDLLEIQPRQRVSEVLRELMRDGDKEVRFRATEAAGKYEMADLIPDLVNGLQDKDWLVRLAGAESLGILNATKAQKWLSRTLTDQNALVRAYAVEALAEIGMKRSIGRLRKLSKTERSQAVKLRIHAALWTLGDDSHFEQVTRFLNFKDYRTRSAAVNILARFGAKMKSKAVRRRIHKILGKARAMEKTVAVRSTLAAALTTLGTENGSSEEGKRKRRNGH